MVCPHDKERNPKTGRCIRKCGEDMERNITTGRCVKKDITDKLRQELDQILEQLRRPKLAGVFDKEQPADPLKCLREIITEDLEAQLERRRRPINILIPKKKHPRRGEKK